jgi:hypothetical protein
MLLNILREKKRKKKFLSFQKVTAEAFRFLTSDYGFEHTSTEITSDWEGSDQCEIVFSNFPLQFHLTYTLNGKFVGGYFDLFERTGGGRWKSYDAFDLAFLIQIRCPEKKVKQDYEQNTEEDVERIVRAYAEILETYGGDVLRGDFRILPEVKRVIEEEHRRDVESGAVFLHADGHPDAGDENP